MADSKSDVSQNKLTALKAKMGGRLPLRIYFLGEFLFEWISLLFEKIV